VISYAELLDVFWQAHSPVAPAYLRQYASLILYHDEEQRRLAEESKRREEQRTGATIYTEIVALKTFYLAEDYHQKYELRGNPALLSAFAAIYPDPDDLRDSTAAARVNGYLAGHGTPADLEVDREGLGLPADAYEELAGTVARYRR
jgi:peptide-methionine (S)-S-oxide reductase